MATEETCRSRFPKKNRGINRSDEATEALLELWAEESIQMCLEHTKSSKETRAVYCCLSTLSQLSGNYFNPKYENCNLLRWLTTVLMEYKSTTFNSFEKGSKLFSPSLFTVCLSPLPFYGNIGQFFVNKWPK